MTERDPKQSLWHQTLLKHQGTNPEIDGQIKANEMGWLALKALTAKDNQTPQFYFNAAAKFVESQYYSPLMLCELTNFGQPFNGVAIIKKHLPVSPSDVTAGTQLQFLNGVRNDELLSHYLLAQLDGRPATDFIRASLCFRHCLRHDRTGCDSADVATLKAEEAFLDWFTFEVDRLQFILEDASKQQINVDPVKMLVVLAWDAADSISYLPTAKRQQLAPRVIKVLETLIDQDPKCLHLYFKLQRCHEYAHQYKDQRQIAQKGIKIAEETQCDYHCANLLQYLARSITLGGLGGSTYAFGVLLSLAEKGTAKLNNTKHWLPKSVFAYVNNAFHRTLECEDKYGRMELMDVVPNRDNYGLGNTVHYCDPASCSVCETLVIKMMKCPCRGVHCKPGSQKVVD